jgi:hypothetical protein
VPAKVEQGCRQRLVALPAETRSLMLVAAGTGQRSRHARRRGSPVTAVDPGSAVDSVSGETRNRCPVSGRLRW